MDSNPTFPVVADGIWIGHVWETDNGWTALAMDGTYMAEGNSGWNGTAYDTRDDAEAVLHSYDAEKKGKK